MICDSCSKEQRENFKKMMIKYYTEKRQEVKAEYIKTGCPYDSDRDWDA